MMLSPTRPMGGPKDGIMSRARQKTWAIISEDGRHVWLGRHSDPTEEEIARAEHQLAAQGLAGWVAIVEGDYWARRGKLGFVMVRPLASPASSFEAGVAAFEDARKAALAQLA
jgi:hypothetical protein